MDKRMENSSQVAAAHRRIGNDHGDQHQDASAGASTCFFGRPTRPLCRRVAWIGLFACGVLVAAFHRPLLEASYRILVVDEPVSECEYGMLVAPSPECFDEAAKMLQRGIVGKALVADQKARRAVQVGAHPEYEDWVSAELRIRGVSDAQIQILNTEATTPHELFRQSDRWILEHSDSPTLVISGDTKTRYYRTVLDQALPRQRAMAYRVRAIASQKTTPDNWWRRRGGVRQVMTHGLRLAFVLLSGESDVDPVDPYQHVVGAG